MRLSPQTGRRIRKRVEEIAALERAVIQAAVERRKKAELLLGADMLSAEYERAYDEWNAAQNAEDAAVDALLLARGQS